MIPALVLVPLFLIGLYILAAAVKILREYERAVVFTLGRFERVKVSVRSWPPAFWGPGVAHYPG
jgi:regulator of protease activity HflC (stomatin/prohibitin superfamily)